MTQQDRPIATWLFITAAAVFAMALIGAITRLTESGLSIVEWKLVTGILPPMNEAAWIHEFGLYQTSPQYKLVNAGMSLDDFKSIYFWEWLHRLFGRLIGVVYAVPLAIFWLRGRIPDAAKMPLLGILILGALQGAMGWFMVKSGLVDQPAVSHYRLAAHLGLAFVIFCCLFYMGLAFSHDREPGADNAAPLRKLVKGTFILAAATMVWGAFVAGLDAGRIYNNNFPFMGKNLWPSEMMAYAPWWKNFVENHAAVQFTHRLLAVLLFCKSCLLVWKSTKLNCPPRVTFLFSALLVMICTQIGLGITTLLTHVNTIVATMHQAGAMIILSLLTALLYNIPKGR